MIINTALTLAVAVALLAAIAMTTAAHAQAGRPTVTVKHRPIVSHGDVSGSWDARQNVIDGKPYAQLLATNPAFRRERMRIECGPIIKAASRASTGVDPPEPSLGGVQGSTKAGPIAVNRGFPLSDLLVIEFSSEAKAEGVREMLLAMQKEYLIGLEDSIVVVKDDNGRIKLNQLFQQVAHGAVSGAPWGSLIGLILMMPPAGGAIGTASDALRDRLADPGINDDFIKQVARTLQSGNAALFLLIRKTTTDKVLAALRGAGGTVRRSSFDETKEEALQVALAGARAASGEAQG